MKNFFYILFFLIIFTVAKADLKNPNKIIKPDQVIKIQLSGLKQNDYPYTDSGIEQTWKFAHPNNQKITGPLNNFKMMLKGDSYSMLLNHEDSKIKQIYISDDVATFEVIILATEKKYYNLNGKLKNIKKMVL
jgi:hypothetical protein